MKVKDVVAVLGVALVTMTFTVALFAPGRVRAVDDRPPGIKPLIAKPELTVDGCVFALKTDKPAYEEGETPVLWIEASNPTGKPVKTTVWASMSGSSPASLRSRVLLPAQPLWSRDWAVNLRPGETKRVSIETETKLASGQLLTISLSNADQSIVARTTSVGPSGQNAASAAQAAPAIQLGSQG